MSEAKLEMELAVAALPKVKGGPEKHEAISHILRSMLVFLLVG